MAQTSRFWTTNATPSGDQQASYSGADFADVWRAMGEGVISGHSLPALDGELACSGGGINTVDVADGAAIVDGIYFESTAVENINVPSAIGLGNTRIDRIVVRVTWASYDAAITRIAGTDAVSPSAPAITQTTETTYDLPLCQVRVDTSGNVVVTDERQWLSKQEPIYIRAIPRNTEWAVEDDVDGFYIPKDFDGKIIKSVHIACHTPSSGGIPTVQIHNKTRGWDVLSTLATIDVGENSSYTAAVQPVVDTDYDEVSTGDFLRIDVDGAGTGTKGLDVIIVLEDD